MEKPQSSMTIRTRFIPDPKQGAGDILASMNHFCCLCPCSPIETTEWNHTSAARQLAELLGEALSDTPGKWRGHGYEFTTKDLLNP